MSLGEVEVLPFGRLSSGEPISAFRLDNGHLQLTVLDYGAIVQSLTVRAADGQVLDIALGYDAIEGYEQDTHAVGAVVGRYANRISHGQFELDGQSHQLQQNWRGHCLHGGHPGFHKRCWQAELEQSNDSVGLRLSYLSPSGEGGFPGSLATQVTYTLGRYSELSIVYQATTDAPTVLNLTQHTYFNLGGHAHGHISDHRLQIHAHEYTPTDDNLIPLGQLTGVENTHYDLRLPTPLEDVLNKTNGLDHNWVLARDAGLVPAAILSSTTSGVQLSVTTDQPGLQCYTGNSLDVANGKQGARYQPYAGVCLETQHFPNSPNQANFPSTALYPGQQFRSETRWQFDHLSSGRRTTA